MPRTRVADPSRTLLLRKQMCSRLRSRFAKLKQAVRQLVGTGLLGNARTFEFHTDAKKVEAFQDWLREQFDRHGLTDEQLWDSYIKAGYRKGALRSFTDYKRKGSGKEFLADAFAQPVARERVELLAGRAYDELENVTADMSNRMSRVLSDGMVEGKSPMDVASDLEDAVDFSRARAETVARTEMIRAHAEGQLMGLRRLGAKRLGVDVEYEVTDDGATCPECEALDGEVYDIDQASGIIPVHPNCRCCFKPYVPDFDEDEEDEDEEPPVENSNPNHDANGQFASAGSVSTSRGSVDVHYDRETTSEEVAQKAVAWLKQLPKQELGKSSANRIEIYENPEDMHQRLLEVGIDPEIADSGQVRGAYHSKGTVYASTWDGYEHSPRTLFHELGHSILGEDEGRAETWAQTHLRGLNTNSAGHWHPGPNPKVRLIVTRDGPSGREVLLVKHDASWNLPGGYQDTDAPRGMPWKPGRETLAQAAQREVREETGVRVKVPTMRVGVWQGDDSNDSSTSWTKHTAFRTHLVGAAAKQIARGDDDADEARWFSVQALPPMNLSHAKVLWKACGYVLNSNPNHDALGKFAGGGFVESAFGGRPIPYEHNPSKSKMSSMAAGSLSKTLRGLADDAGNIVVWDGDRLLHEDMQSKLGIPKGLKRMFITREAPGRLKVEVSRVTAQWLDEHPHLKSLDASKAVEDGSNYPYTMLTNVNPNHDEKGQFASGAGVIQDKFGQSYPVQYTEHDRTYTIGVPGKEALQARGVTAGGASMHYKGKMISSVGIHPEFRRKGLASALYDHIEKHIGKKLEENWATTTDGAAFWKARKGAE